jgi:transcriptional regulator with XRE-family HTH domain
MLSLTLPDTEPTQKFNPLKARAIREAAGLSRRQLAERTGISMNSIARYESGIVPSEFHARRLAAELGCRFDVFGLKTISTSREVDHSREGKTLSGSFSCRTREIGIRSGVV